MHTNATNITTIFIAILLFLIYLELKKVNENLWMIREYTGELYQYSRNNNLSDYFEQLLY